MKGKKEYLFSAILHLRALTQSAIHKKNALEKIEIVKQTKL